jgi:hypothetical protein
MMNDSAGAPPTSPVMKVKEDMVGKLQDEPVTLIPYGAARLRITSFPVLGPDVLPQKK